MSLTLRSFSYIASTACLGFLLNSCGDVNPYKKREPRCKSNCNSAQGENGFDQISADQNAGGDGTKRQSLGLSLDARFWIDKIPFTSLSNSEVVSLLLSHPFVQLSAGQEGYQELGTSLDAGFKALQTRINTAAGIDGATAEKNPTARCYRSEFEQVPERRSAGDGYLYKAEPGLCFSAEQVTASLQGNDPQGSPNQAATQRAITYEDTVQLLLPEEQGGFSLSQIGPLFTLIKLGTSGNIPQLSFLKTASTNFTQASLQHLQIQGIEITDRQKNKFYELNWDFFSAGNTETNETLSLKPFSKLSEATSESTTLSAPEGVQGYVLSGSFSHSSGHSVDRQKLSLNGSQEAFAYARIITFQDFRLWYTSPQTFRGLAAAFDKSAPAFISGRFVVEIPQPQNTLVFTAVASGQACLVEFFAGQDVEKPENSLGVRDLCVVQGKTPE